MESLIKRADDALYRALDGRIDIERVGDCLAPGTIATCVRSGHAYAQEMDATFDRDMPFRRETLIP